MILSDNDIIREIQAGNIVCFPFDQSNLSNSSIDLRLGRYILSQKKSLFDRLGLRRNPTRFSTDKHGRLTVKNAPEYDKNDLLDCYNLESSRGYESKQFVLNPGQFVLAQTLELVGHPNHSIISEVKDKSTLARLGLSVCFSAGYIDAGNVLSITLELKNNGHQPIELQYGMHICQVKFHYLNSPCDNRYSGKYNNSVQTQGAI